MSSYYCNVSKIFSICVDDNVIMLSYMTNIKNDQYEIEFDKD